MGKRQEHLRQHRTIRQEPVARDFSSAESLENRGILGVFPVFQTARMGEKTRHPAADAIVRCCLNIEKSAQLPTLVRSCGSYAAFSGVSKDLGLTAILQKHFPEQAEDIMTVAHYMLTRDNVMYYLPDWLEENVSFGGQELTSANLSRLFAGITPNDRILFFNDWMKHKKAQAIPLCSAMVPTQHL